MYDISLLDFRLSLILNIRRMSSPSSTNELTSQLNEFEGREMRFSFRKYFFISLIKF